ncbi:hypothetical protein CGRA01v4_14131 [Colletotrichum graminicola]|uniref:Uncharacterized protein n=1 Tax=Colletotrichum graminicola (strain M1.001 / M2 / FGSC 10212) TaxID=645133 RepID=E3QUZ0_COLGM|nr:uncharacterized protein GLRG_09822 [Colletotrichum graminicola M1.001]EFQ34678.1 hypothetical protein GLRG_09822 [Colletotrichum graminicola M1.001]WDK22840.1 hypothetical protein CGRA01v4_14131 [Colletotrichum graminicola]
MKLSVILATLALAVSSAQACAKYKNCWCVRNNVEYQGRIQDIASDEDTVKACAGTGDPGYYGQNFQECHRYKHGWWPFTNFKAINNCEWTDKCVAAGATIGYCRDKI